MIKFDVATVFNLVAAAQATFEALVEAAEDFAETLAEQGQPELKAKLAQLRADNDAARARRAAKAAQAAKG